MLKQNRADEEKKKKPPLEKEKRKEEERCLQPASSPIRSGAKKDKTTSMDKPPYDTIIRWLSRDDSKPGRLCTSHKIKMGKGKGKKKKEKSNAM